MIGRIVVWRQERFFGFIRSDQTAKDTFVHGRQLEAGGIKHPREGTWVEFDIGVNERNNMPEAVNLKALPKDEAAEEAMWAGVNVPVRMGDSVDT
jgi:cold shock CspA family protein